MKKFKALLTGILTATLLSVTAAGSITANAESDAKGSITITGTTAGETYTAYEVLEYTAVDESLNNGEFTDTHGTYKVTSEWVEFFTSSEYNLSSYVTKYNDDYYVTGANDKTSAKELAVAIQTGSIKYIASHQNLTVAGSVVAPEGTDTATITNLPYGYYVIDSSLGAINSTGLTAPSVEVKEKNSTTPAPEKEVQENSAVGQNFDLNDKSWGEWNDGQIGDTVTFKTKVTILPKTTNVVLHDTMDASLSYNEDVAVYYAEDAAGTNVTETVKTKAVAAKDGNGFTVSFATDYTESLTSVVYVTVVYTANITNAAEVNKGQMNETYVSYGNGGKTEYDRTYTYTYDINIVKQGDDGKALSDTHFNLLAADQTTVLKVVKNDDGVYTLATAKDTDNVTEDIVTSSEGKIQIKGLDTGVYYLRETQAKAGYNMLTDDIKISIAGSVTDTTNHTAVGTITATYGENDSAKIGNVSVKDNVLYVVNTTGAYLPSTGGVGTTMFYLVGGVLILSAVAAFIVKRKAAA